MFLKWPNHQYRCAKFYNFFNPLKFNMKIEITLASAHRKNNQTQTN